MRPLQFEVAASGIDTAEGIAIADDGTIWLSRHGDVVSWSPASGFGTAWPAIAPAGIALDGKGGLIVAGMGLLGGTPGPLQRLDLGTGARTLLVEEIGGRTLVASNFPVVARDGTIYCSHSSWGPAQNIGRRDGNGFIYRYSDGMAVIVAEGLRGANGLCLDAAERYLYCAVTAEGRIRRWPIGTGGSLGASELYGPPLGEVVDDHIIADIRAMAPMDRARLGYCDGLAFDMAGNLWVTLPFANRLVAITPDGKLAEIVHDPLGAVISMPTNIAWGGADRRDLYVVNRGAGTLAVARTEEAGLALAGAQPARNAARIE